MPPSIPERTQVWRTISLVGIKLDRYLGNLQTDMRGVGDHLGGELHPWRAWFHTSECIFRKCAHAAVEIADRHVEGGFGHHRQDRVAEVTVQGGHRAGFYTAPKTVSHHKDVALRNSLDKSV